LLIGCVTGSAHAQRIYKWVDERGVTHFSDSPYSDKAQGLDIAPSQPPAEQPPQPGIDTSWMDTAPQQPEIIMYGASWCSVCKQARHYFSEHNIAYTEYDVETSSKGKHDYSQLNGTGVPIFLVDGQRYNGFTPSSFDTLLKKHN
jgi:glutaredoxin